MSQKKNCPNPDCNEGWIRCGREFCLCGGELFECDNCNGTGEKK